MALTTLPQNDAAPIASSASDYGSDIDEATADQVFSQAESQPLNSVIINTIEAPVIADDHGDDDPLVRIARIRENLSEAIAGLDSVKAALAPKKLPREASVEIEYDQSNRATFSRKRVSSNVIKLKLTC